MRTDANIDETKAHESTEGVPAQQHTPTPWNWLIHDHSMASLGVMPDPGLGNPLVLAIGPCPSCADRAQPREWKWGRCHTPSEADAEFIVRAVNSYDAMVKALEPFAECVRDDGSVTENMCPADYRAASAVLTEAKATA